MLFPLALVVGAALYMTAPFEPGWEMLVPPALLLALAWWAVRRRGGWLGALLLGLMACLATGALAGKVRTALVAAPILREQIGPVRIEGVIAEIDASERSRRVRVQVRAIEGLSPANTPPFVRFSFKGEMAYAPGRAVSCRAILSPPPRPVVPDDYLFHRDAFFQQLGGVGFSTGGCEPMSVRPPTSAIDGMGQWLGAVRRALAAHVAETAGPGGGGMAAAMVSGDRSFIAPDDAEALRLSGLAHLLSISGVHMVLVGGIVFFIFRMGWPLIEPLALRAPSVQAAALAAILACTAYFAISGMEVATQRAYIIALIGFGAKLFDRPAISLRSLAVALGVVVLLQPESVVTPGFQMSFAASGALIALYEMWPRMEHPEAPGLFRRVGAWIVAAAATSLVASLATLPFALHHFDRAALFSVLANIAATPIITLWTTPAAAAAALAAPFGLHEPFLWLMGQSLDVVLTIAHYSVETSPDIDLPRLSGAGMALAAAAIALFCILRGRGRAFAALPGAAAIALWLGAPQAVGYVAADGSVFLKSGRQWLELTDWRADNGLDPLIISDFITPSPCPGKGGACWVETDAGQAIVTPSDASAPNCPGGARLHLVRDPDGATEIRPCDLAGAGGAVIEQSGSALSVRAMADAAERPWNPPLVQRPAPPARDQ